MSDVPRPTLLGSALADFSWSLYCRISSSGQSSNIFLSPLSICFALATTFAGSSGDTKQQLKKVLFRNLSDLSDEALHSLFADILRHVNQGNAPYKLHVANCLYPHESFVGDLLPAFTAVLKEKYGSELRAIDFRDEQNARKSINAWVSEHTNEKIKEVVAPGVLNDLTRLVLVNAIYFKGDWKKKFDPKYTGRQKFHVSGTETVDVEMMSIVNSNFYYTATEGYQALGMAYNGEDLCMYIFLPIKPRTLANMEKLLTGTTLLEKILQMNWKRDLDCVAIPKFKLEETVNLVPVLQQLGVGDMFDKHKADFSNINREKSLYVSDVVHKAVVEVNEEGTEAAACTACMMMACSGPSNPSFIADHPFLFTIVDKSSNSILFLGRYTGKQ